MTCAAFILHFYSTILDYHNKTTEQQSDREDARGSNRARNSDTGGWACRRFHQWFRYIDDGNCRLRYTVEWFKPILCLLLKCNKSEQQKLLKYHQFHNVHRSHTMRYWVDSQTWIGGNRTDFGYGFVYSFHCRCEILIIKIMRIEYTLKILYLI